MIKRTAYFASVLLRAFCVAGVLAAQSHAQEDGPGLALTGEIQADGYYNDNFYSQARNKDRVFGTILKPGGKIVADRGRLKLNLNAGAQYGVFDSPSDSDNYIDYNANAGTEYLWDTLNKTTAAFTHSRGHDPFGAQRTEAQPATLGTSLDQWHSNSAKAGYRYGTKDAPINIDISLNVAQKRYISNLSQTSQLNNSNLSGRSEIFYNYSPKTALVLEAAVGRVYFSDPGTAPRGRNGTYKTLLLGTRWKATAQTTGDVRVGYLLRNFDDTSERRFQAINWNASVTWTPLTLTSLKLTTGRSAQDSYNNARFVDSLFTRLELNQKFSDRINAGLSAGYTRSKFVEASRKDDGYAAGVNASYVLDKSLTLIGSANYTKRQTDFPVLVVGPNTFDLNYDGTTAYLGLRYAP